MKWLVMNSSPLWLFDGLLFSWVAFDSELNRRCFQLVHQPEDENPKLRKFCCKSEIGRWRPFCFCDPIVAPFTRVSRILIGSIHFQGEMGRKRAKKGRQGLSGVSLGFCTSRASWCHCDQPVNNVRWVLRSLQKQSQTSLWRTRHSSNCCHWLYRACIRTQ